MGANRCHDRFCRGGLAHLYDLLVGGVQVYAACPVPLQVFFHSLLVFDPLVVALLWRYRPAGAVLAGLVMALDLAANWSVCWRSVMADPAQLLNPVGLPSITLFGVFVLTTCGPLRSALDRRTHESPGR